VQLAPLLELPAPELLALELLALELLAPELLALELLALELAALLLAALLDVLPDDALDVLPEDALDALDAPPPAPDEAVEALVEPLALELLALEPPVEPPELAPDVPLDELVVPLVEPYGRRIVVPPAPLHAIGAAAPNATVTTARALCAFRIIATSLASTQANRETLRDPPIQASPAGPSPRGCARDALCLGSSLAGSGPQARSEAILEKVR
jgi:hypothetical protein